jgi:uncharacterized membrane protein
MTWGLVFLFSAILFTATVIRYFVMNPINSNAIQIEIGFEMFDFHYKPWNVALYVHIITALLALIIGPFQFLKAFRNKNLRLHRNLGKIYVISILISGIAGIYLSFYAYGGLVAKSGFFFLAAVWLYTTSMAYSTIRKRQVKLHEKWMYRSFAVTFAAVTFRIWTTIIGYSLDNFMLGYQISA